MNSIIFIMEMIGTVAFAISGVLAAKEKKMDLETHLYGSGFCDKYPLLCI